MKPTLLTALMATTAVASADTALTIYNQNLAVVRESLPVELKAGESSLIFDRATAQVLPDSVVLRDPAGKASFTILEQSYRNDPVSKGLLLQHFEGKEIDFRIVYQDGKVEVKPGKIIRSGYVPGGGMQDPIIEMDGKMRFSLPGEPLFPELGNQSILRPTLSWALSSQANAKFNGQLSYLSRGFQWEADYNFVAPEKSNEVTLTGWVTVKNNSGTNFDKATVKLVAGDVNIIQPNEGYARDAMPMAKSMRAESVAQVTQKAFDDFHLYSLARPLTIRDKETKQVEFLRSPKVIASKKYIYDAAKMRFHGRGSAMTNPLPNLEFPKDVAIYWKFRNSDENGLGVPLPAGRVRFYREDSADKSVEFVGENNIDHTPKNEDIEIYTGNAFDLVGERKITDFKYNDREDWVRESVEVTVKNRSEEPKEIIVREHLYRWSNWKIENNSMPFEKKDVDTIEFTVKLAPNEEKKVTYTAFYNW